MARVGSRAALAHDLSRRFPGALYLTHDDPFPGDVIATGTPAGSARLLR